MNYDRRSELEEFKRVNLSIIASSYGYEINRKKSTRHSVLMANGADKIIISQNGDHYIFCSVHNLGSGTAIDFIQTVIEPGCSLGRVRQLLRPFLNQSYLTTIQQSYTGKYAAEIRPSETDLIAVAARYSKFDPIAQPHSYLCHERGIPFELLQSPRLRDQIRHSPKGGSIAFPHWGYEAGKEKSERCLVGYEIKGPNVNMFSKGGRKALWMSTALKGDHTLAVAESGLDALSYLALQGTEGTRVASISGKMNPEQPKLLRMAIERMTENSHIIAAFDNDPGGDELTERLQVIVSKTGRRDLEFKDVRPPARGSDWNQVLVQDALKAGRIQTTGPSLGL
ncbi:hypothetical protein Pla110_24780 [Polystyrenella longa]|uniref:DUF3991 domain-containing protein n=1 Tax=Polystyrenella longa TaxID=2528007 RepID=A0A518CND6_9PLAN|nr:toprim domain-containing protein [Polystyrenella longa]QDU80745.1 hypothetical protein Pla110_24780 [Polystyrenella longa]